MKALKIFCSLVLLSLVTCHLSLAQSRYGDLGTPQITGFKVTSPSPLDVDQIWEKLADTVRIDPYESCTRYFVDVEQEWWFKHNKWQLKSNGESGSDEYDGNFAITSVPVAGTNYGGTTVQEFLDNVFKQSVAPQCNIQLSATQLEYASSGTTNITVTWSVTRPAGCTEIVSIIVDGQVITPTGNSQSGTLTVSVPKNTNKTFTIQVSSTDKSASKSATLTFLWKRYWGRLANSNPTNADILSLSGAGVGTGSELASGFAKTYDGINGAGQYLVFAFPDAWGVPEFFINGLVSTAFTKRTLTFTNASGGQTTYQVWVSNTPQNSPITQFVIR